MADGSATPVKDVATVHVDVGEDGSSPSTNVNDAQPAAAVEVPTQHAGVDNDDEEEKASNVPRARATSSSSQPGRRRAKSTPVEEMENPPTTELEMRLTYGAFHALKLTSVPSVVLEWKDLHLRAEVPKKKVVKGDPTIIEEDGKFYKAILRGVSGYARPGEMIAIMGASGAGKSSLLNVLARRNCKNTGEVLINGHPLTKEYTSITSYIQQDDLFFGNLTVKQHLVYQTLLRKGNMSESEAELYCEELMANLGLRKARNNVIGSIQQNLARGISGGERKRLSVASEILTNPSLLFVDEPTTGLDAYMAEGVMRTMKSIASAGRTVLVTIHQPSSEVWALFDRVCLMCDGRVAFFGDREDAVEHFGRLGYECPEYSNPADFLIKSLALMPADTSTEEAYQAALAVERRRLADINSAWDARVLEEKCDRLEDTDRTAWAQQSVKPTSRYVTTWWQQMKILSKRAMIYELKDPLLVKARAFQTFFLAILLGIIYLRLGKGQANVQDRNGAMYFMMMNQSFNGLFSVLQTFPFEQPVFQREYENGSYSVSAYYLAKFMASLIPQIVFPSIFVTIIFWMIGFHDDVVVWLWSLLIVFLVSQCATSLGYLISLATPNVTVATAVAPVILLPFFIFGGLFINVDSIPVYFIWLEASSFFKYGFSALAGVIWDGMTLDCPPAPQRCPYPNGQAVLDALSFDTAYRLRDLLLLGGMIVLLRALGFVLLYRKAQRRQNE